MNASKMAIQKKRANLVSMIKNVTLKQSETKYLTKTVQVSNEQSNDIAIVRLWGSGTAADNVMPLQGNTDGTRNGDSIVATGYKVRYHMQYNDRFNIRIHFYYIPWSQGQGNPTVQSQLQHNVTGFLELDPIQTKRWPGLRYLGCKYVRATDNNQSDKVIAGKLWIPLKKTIKFTGDSTNQPANLPEQGCIIYFVTGFPIDGPDPGDFKIARGNFVTTLYYKDP